MAKKIGKVILIIYLTLATIASVLFGYLYFTKSIEQSQDEMNISIKGLMSILSEDINNLINKQNISGLSSIEGSMISTLDADVKNSRLGIPLSEYAEMDTNWSLGQNDSKAVLDNFKYAIDLANSKIVEKLTTNGKILNCVMDLYTYEETTEGNGVWVSLAAEYKEGHLYLYFRINQDNIMDNHIEYMIITNVYDIKLNETRDDYTEIHIYGGPTEFILNGERKGWGNSDSFVFIKENSEIVCGYELQGYPSSEQGIEFNYHTDEVSDTHVTSLRIQEFDYNENLSLYASWNNENSEDGVLAKYKDVKDKLYQGALYCHKTVIKLLDEKLGANKFENNKLIFS